MTKHKLPEIFFVVGPPRSGTQVLMDFLSVPKSMGWITQRLAEHPGRLRLASKANRLNWPLLGEFYLERRDAWKRVPQPAMGDAFWKHYVSQFTPPDDTPWVPGPEHLDETEVENLREAVKEICHRQRRFRFVAEYTGFPRIRMMRKAFPEAKFLQVIRDPRSVAYLMVKKKEGANQEFWKHRALWIPFMPDPLQKRLETLPDTPLNFCGVWTRWLHDLYKEERSELPEGDHTEVAYSDLLSRPEVTLKKVLNFTGLPVTKRFNYYVKFHEIQQSNLRTRRNISTDEADQLAIAVSKT